MDNQKILSHYISHHQSAVSRLLSVCGDDFSRWVDLAAATIRGGKKILWFGNGGSAAEAQHIAAELAVKFWHDRAPLAAIALATDPSSMTAAGNDYGFEFVFARQIDAIANPGDMAVGYSTSGNSKNILRALQTAQSKGVAAIGLTGQSGGSMPAHCDLCLRVPAQDTPHIQELHTILGHAFCAALESQLGLVTMDKYPWKTASTHSN